MEFNGSTSFSCAHEVYLHLKLSQFCRCAIAFMLKFLNDASVMLQHLHRIIMFDQHRTQLIERVKVVKSNICQHVTSFVEQIDHKKVFKMFKHLQDFFCHVTQNIFHVLTGYRYKRLRKLLSFCEVFYNIYYLKLLNFLRKMKDFRRVFRENF